MSQQREHIERQVRIARSAMETANNLVYDYVEEETRKICEQYDLHFLSAYSTMFYKQGTQENHTQWLNGYIIEVDRPKEFDNLMNWLYGLPLELHDFSI